MCKTYCSKWKWQALNMLLFCNFKVVATIPDIRLKKGRNKRQKQMKTCGTPARHWKNSIDSWCLCQCFKPGRCNGFIFFYDLYESESSCSKLKTKFFGSFNSIFTHATNLLLLCCWWSFYMHTQTHAPIVFGSHCILWTHRWMKCHDSISHRQCVNWYYIGSLYCC